jgi:hypothetical protein
MKMEDCINDPKFRKEFILHEVDNLKKVIDGNGNMLYHNSAKISILKEIRDKLNLTSEEDGIVLEHMSALEGLEDDVSFQSSRLETMIKIYEKFKREILESNLKLA